MLTILAIFLFLLARNTKGTQYVDLKSGNISDAVEVFHGYTMEYAKYVMYAGTGDKDLEYVFWGNDLIHPLEDYIPGSHMLLLESYKAGNMHFLVIYDYEKLGPGIISPIKLYYELQETGFRRVSVKAFHLVMFDKVYLTLDIAAPTRHPFINEDIDSDQEPGVITRRLTIKKSFKGLNIHGVGTQKYMIGRVYDSSMNIVCGYSKLSYLAQKCSLVEIEKRSADEKITLRRYCKTVMVYDKCHLMDSPVWYSMSEAKENNLEREPRDALMLKKRILLNDGSFPLITLDIAEGICPELLGIEKITGKSKGIEYTLYQLRGDFIQNYSIKRIVDTDLKKHIIMNCRENAVHTSAEIFTDVRKMYLVVRSLIKVDSGFEKEVRVFKKVFDDTTFYVEVMDEFKDEILDFIKSLEPIGIQINIDEPAKYLYEKGTSVYEETQADYYHLKDADDVGNSPSQKYIFDGVWENNKYEIGNTPIEGNSRVRNLLRDKLYQTRFVVTYEKSDIPTPGTIRRGIYAYEELVQTA